MIFEFDPAKSISNKAKHGIDFEEAKRLWDDFRLLEAPALTADEPRFVAVGVIDQKHWTAIFTYRETAIRLISVRRARKEEVSHYESA
jgi:uncharacterized protein